MSQHLYDKISKLEKEVAKAQDSIKNLKECNEFRAKQIEALEDENSNLKGQLKFADSNILKLAGEMRADKVQFERNNAFAHKRIVELEKREEELKTAFYSQVREIADYEAKIEAANKILEPKISAQQYLINTGSTQAVYALYFSKQELITLSDAIHIPRIEKQETADPVAELMKQGKC